MTGFKCNKCGEYIICNNLSDVLQKYNNHKCNGNDKKHNNNSDNSNDNNNFSANNNRFEVIIPFRAVPENQNWYGKRPQNLLQFYKSVNLYLNSIKKPYFSDKVKIEIKFVFSDKRKRDLDHLLTPVFNILKAKTRANKYGVGIIHDDSKIIAINAYIENSNKDYIALIITSLI